MKTIANKLREELKINPELVADFFVIFSRFEYALKRSGYAGIYRDGETVYPNWNKYARDIKGKLNMKRDNQLKEAVEYFKHHPPLRQIVRNNVLDWTKGKDDAEALSLEEYLVKTLKTVRNNLFHGGKFPNPTGPIHEPSRDEKLLKSCLVVIDRLLRLHTSTGYIFYEFA